mmetsp:Transcript_28481/g.59457  ORF Transcript_28481/g.59457 Transcript_28481/m.59457 type:complete len:91 (+) Transcript_28481:162-434(+)
MICSRASTHAAVHFYFASRRHMGGFPSSMKIKKNMVLEEWNGKREMTEKTWELNFSDLPMAFITMFLFPFGVYASTRAELKTRFPRKETI